MRQTGRTTRQADAYIQMLFSFKIGEKVQVSDHTGITESTKNLIEIIKKRIKIEHPFLIVQTTTVKGKFYLYFSIKGQK